MKSLVGVAAVLVWTAVPGALGRVYFEETFDDPAWTTRWAYPAESDALGRFALSSGRFFADEAINQGLQTLDNGKFYALTSKLAESFVNAGKDLVLQFSVKHEQGLNCGGGYIKLADSTIDPKVFGGQTPFEIMFGPDVCGSKKQVHVILAKDSTGRMIKRTVDFPNDNLTHMYTLVVSQPQGRYRVLVDGKEAAAGAVDEDWDGLVDITVPKYVSDTDEQKPADWVDAETIDDPEDTKPADWDAKHGRFMLDPRAERPPPDSKEYENGGGPYSPGFLENPDFKEWKARQIPNPAYKGPWKASMVPNPAYKLSPDAAAFKPIGFVGIDLWQVSAGSIFDNILLTDSFAEAETRMQKLFLALVDKEHAALEAIRERQLASLSQSEQSAAEDTPETDATADSHGESERTEL